jgi:hypothetical protein
MTGDQARAYLPEARRIERKAQYAEQTKTTAAGASLV